MPARIPPGQKNPAQPQGFTTVARLFGILQKKRGDRRSGSALSGFVGEIAFFLLVLILGMVSLGFLLFAPDESLGFWLLLLVVVSLLVIGGGGLLLAYLHYGISPERHRAITQKRPALDLLKENVLSSDRFPSIPSDAAIIDSPGTRLRYRLPRFESAFWPMLAASLFSLSWLAVTVTLVVTVVNSVLNAQPYWLFSTMLLGSIVVTNWATRYCYRQVRHFTRVGTTMMEISHHPLIPGSSCEGFFLQSGSMKLRSLRISLVCEEQATYRQGTDLRIETHHAFKQEIVSLENRDLRSDRVLEHEFQFAIPESVMHSFRGEHNQVQWKLVVRGKPESYPRFTRSFLLIVHPRNPAREAG